MEIDKRSGLLYIYCNKMKQYTTNLPKIIDAE